MSVTDLESEEWISYDEFSADQLTQDMLEHFDIPRPADIGLNPPPGFFLPPPPIPSDGEHCAEFIRLSDLCDVSKSPSTSVESPHLPIISLFVIVSCIVITVSCATIFVIWRRRRSKSRLHHLHYQLDGNSSSSSTQFYDDLLANFPHSGRQNTYTEDKTVVGRREEVKYNAFLLCSPDDPQESLSLPIYEEIYHGGEPGLLLNQDVPRVYDLNSELVQQNDIAGPFLVQHQSLVVPGQQHQPTFSSSRDQQTSRRQRFGFLNNRNLGNNPYQEVKDALSDEYSEILGGESSPYVDTRDEKATVKNRNTRYMKTMEHPRTKNGSMIPINGSKTSRRPISISSNCKTYHFPQSYKCSRPALGTGEQRLMPNPDDILPKHAWTDMSETSDYAELENLVQSKTGKGSSAKPIMDRSIPTLSRDETTKPVDTRLDRNNPTQSREVRTSHVGSNPAETRADRTNPSWTRLGEVNGNDCELNVLSPSDATMSECQFQSSPCSSDQTSR